jgi:hypothetical protein
MDKTYFRFGNYFGSFGKLFLERRAHLRIALTTLMIVITLIMVTTLMSVVFKVSKALVFENDC